VRSSRLSGQSVLFVVCDYWFPAFYEVAGPRYALRCFATHVEAKSPPVSINLCSMPDCNMHVMLEMREKFRRKGGLYEFAATLHGLDEVAPHMAVSFGNMAGKPVQQQDSCAEYKVAQIAFCNIGFSFKHHKVFNKALVLLLVAVHE